MALRGCLRTSETEELFQAGQKAIYSWEYTIVNEKGNLQGNDIITLEEGDTFPVVDGINAYYQLNPTCLEEECEPTGGETPEVE